MNETGFFEAARHFAHRVLESKPDDNARMDYAFRLATGRSPSAQEKEVLNALLADRKAFYKAHPEEAAKAA